MPESDVPSSSRAFKELPKSEMPRERLRALGANALKTEELIAILLRTGYRGENVLQLAARLLNERDGLSGLARLPVSELVRIKGIGEAKGIGLAAALELGQRMAREPIVERKVVQSPRDAAKFFNDMGTLEQEVMRVLLLDTKNRVLAAPTIYRGSLHTTVIRINELFREAVRRNCASIIVAHNHPSGDPTPSPEDVAVTREIVQAGKVLDIDVLDHVVVGAGENFVSLKEKGLGFG